MLFTNCFGICSFIRARQFEDFRQLKVSLSFFFVACGCQFTLYFQSTLVLNYLRRYGIRIVLYVLLLLFSTLCFSTLCNHFLISKETCGEITRNAKRMFVNFAAQLCVATMYKYIAKSRSGHCFHLILLFMLFDSTFLCSLFKSKVYFIYLVDKYKQQQTNQPAYQSPAIERNKRQYL